MSGVVIMAIYCIILLKASSVHLCAVIYNLVVAPVQREDIPLCVITLL